MSAYVIVICIMLVMFAGLAIFVAQADADERRFLTKHEDDPLLTPTKLEQQHGPADADALDKPTREMPVVAGDAVDSPAAVASDSDHGSTRVPSEDAGGSDSSSTE